MAAPAVSVGCSVALLTVFSMQAVMLKSRFGYAHIILFLWTILQIPSLVYQLYFPEKWTAENDELVQGLIYDLNIVDYFTTVSLELLLWVIIGRFKRVEVQVVQDDQETTFGIFKKIKLLKYYQIAFLAIVLSFLIPSGVKVKTNFDDYYNPNYDV